jgi:Transposase DDE domain
MTTAQVGYTPVYRWVKQVLGDTHTTVVATVAWAVLCLLVAQRVTSAALARALPAEQAGSGRSCLRRVRRWWSGPALDQATISPALLRLALALLAADHPVVVALDTTRLGPWEVWLAGIVVAGRTLPIGWAVIPYPWPKGYFRATTLALIQQLQQAFPAGVRWTLVADRGFPSAVLFAQLRQGGTDFSVRLRLSDWVTVDRVYATVSAHLTAGRLVVGQRTAAMSGRGTLEQPLVPAAIVVSAAVVTPPRHKQNPGTARERAHRAKQHAQHRKHKQGRKTKPPSAVAQRYAQTWVLFTTASTVAQAVAEYAGRMSIEETYRDWHHHWAVRAAVVGLPTEAMVTRLIGVVCLAYTVQMHLGQRVRRDPMSQQRRAQWTVTDRISWFWCGQRLFDDPGYDWSGWLAQQWESLGQLVTTDLASPVSETASLSALEEAA